jgi:hypothetical protein
MHKRVQIQASSKKELAFFLERSAVFAFVLFKMSAVGTFAERMNPAREFWFYNGKSSFANLLHLSYYG